MDVHQLLTEAVETGQAPGALVVLIERLAYHDLLRTSQVQRRLQRRHLAGSARADADPAAVREIIDQLGDFGSQVEERIAELVFGRTATGQSQAVTLARRTLDLVAPGRGRERHLRKVVRLYVVDRAVEKSDRSTSTRKSLETQFRNATEAGLIDEVVHVTFKGGDDWRLRLDACVEAGLIGPPLAIQPDPDGRRVHVFVTFAKNQGGGAYGITGSSRRLGAPGFAATLSRSAEPWTLWSTTESVSLPALFSEAGRVQIRSIRSSANPVRGKRPIMPRAEVHRVFLGLLDALNGGVIRRKTFFAAVYARYLPQHIAFRGTMSLERSASLQGAFRAPDAITDEA